MPKLPNRLASCLKSEIDPVTSPQTTVSGMLPEFKLKYTVPPAPRLRVTTFPDLETLYCSFQLSKSTTLSSQSKSLLAPEPTSARPLKPASSVYCVMSAEENYVSGRHRNSRYQTKLSPPEVHMLNLPSFTLANNKSSLLLSLALTVSSKLMTSVSLSRLK